MARSPSEPLDGLPDEPAAAGSSGFRVSLANFDGPFDLLLQLISKHEMDVTEIALSRVTDEFISYLSDAETGEELDRASEFLVVAVTLLDMKVAGLLPQGELVDAEAVAALEARDLLFARLLQYRAFKEVATWFGDRLGRENRRHTRQVRIEEKHRSRTPELRWTLTPEQFAALALVALTPRPAGGIGLEHLHAPAVSIREQAAIVVATLRGRGTMSFRELVSGEAETGVVVARFLAVLELYRHAAIAFEQIEPLGDLTLTWTSEHWTDEKLATLGAEYDR